MPLRVNDKKAILWITAIVLIANVAMYFYSSKNERDGIVSTSSYNNDENTASIQNTKLSNFDPNTADYNRLTSLGLKPNVAHTIINYRKAGGVFRKPSDLSKIYTLSDSDYQRLLPYIKIQSSFKSKDKDYVTKNYPSQDRTNSYDTNSYTKHVYSRSEYYSSPKLKQGQTVNLNTADSTQLQRIPGIGPYYANKIIRYRNRLGGFVSISQIKEIQGLPSDIEKWLSFSKTNINKLNINHLTFGQLLRHPYLNYEQVVAIFNYRKVYGTIHSLNDLENYSAFKPSDFTRLYPYIDFSE